MRAGAGLDDAAVEGEAVDDGRAQARGPVNVLVQPPKDSFEAVAAPFFSRSARTRNEECAASAAESHAAELVDAEQADAAVSAARPGELLLVGGLDELVDQLPSPART